MQRQWIILREVLLGDKHESQLRQLLLNGDQGAPDRYCCAMLDLQYNGKGCEDFTYQPERGRDEETGQRIYKIIMGGYMYVFHISSEPAPEMVRPLSVSPKGEMLILSGNAQNILNFWAQALGAAGKL